MDLKTSVDTPSLERRARGAGAEVDESGKRELERLASLSESRGSLAERLGAELLDFDSPSMLVRLVQRCVGLRELDRVYRESEAEQGSKLYYQALLDYLNISWDVSPDDVARIPRTGGLLVVANHPFGLIEGTLLGALFQTLRPDVRIMANQVLERYPKVCELCIPVNPFGGASASRENRRGLRQSLTWLRKGGALVVFPAGEVASLDLKRRAVLDPAWHDNVARLAAMAQVPVLPMYLEGRNGVGFHLAGLLHPRLRTALLLREFLNKAGKTIVVRTGSLVSPKKLDSLPDDAARIDYLRRKTYVLANRQAPKSGLPFLTPHKISMAAQTDDGLEPVAQAVDFSLLKGEIARLPAESLLDEQGDQFVYLAKAESIPNIMREIGRLRETTFRAMGEGSGRALDLDEFDAHYLHLFIWNVAKSEIVGAYRLGQSDLILRNFGKRGFYTSSLFSYGRTFLERINPAIEMGRSFVRAEYQKSYAPLLLLWRGVGVYVSRNPQYKMLFGPVSISNDYHPNSRGLMVSFLKEYCRADDLAHFVRARSPFRTKPKKGLDGLGENSVAWDIEELSAFISDIETDQKGVPILIKQYLRLGGKLLGFNVDVKFSNALDGLIVVDLLKTDPKFLERYMGKANAAGFLAYHHGEVARVQ